MFKNTKAHIFWHYQPVLCLLQVIIWVMNENKDSGSSIALPLREQKSMLWIQILQVKA